MKVNKFESTNRLFEKIKSMSFFERIFSWKDVLSLSMESCKEIGSVEGETENAILLDSELRTLQNDLRYTEGEKNKLQSENEKLKDDIKKNNLEIQAKENEIGKVKESDDKNRENINSLQNELEILKEKKDDLFEKNKENEKKITAFEATEKKKQEEYEHKVTELNSVIDRLDQEKLRLRQEREKEIMDQNERMRETWKNHEHLVEEKIQEICGKWKIEYLDKEKFPFKGKPDNTIKICDDYIIFDAKSPLSDDLSNFQNYLKLQAGSVKKYLDEQNVKKDIFLVVPFSTMEVIKEYFYNMTDYNVFVVTMDSLEPIILNLYKIKDYKFAKQLSPEDRESICRTIGKFAHITKRKIQIDSFFAQECIDILTKYDKLPLDIRDKAIEYEKSDKLNPPMEKRDKQISLDEMKKDIKKIKQKAECEEINCQIDFKKIEEIPLYTESNKAD